LAIKVEKTGVFMLLHRCPLLHYSSSLTCAVTVLAAL